MTSATRGDGSVRRPATRGAALVPFAISPPMALVLAALGVVVGAAAGIATCALWGLV